MKIDYREKKIIKHFPDAEVCNLTVGDIVDGNVCIERKDSADFINSIIDNRIFNQAQNMKDNYEKSYIFIEGDFKSISDYISISKRKIFMSQVRGVIASILVRYNVPILFCSTHLNLVKMSKLVLEKNSDNKCIRTIINPVKKHANPKMQILLAIKGIGKIKAEKILEHYQYFENIDINNRPEGISKNDIKKVLEVLK